MWPFNRLTSFVKSLRNRLSSGVYRPMVQRRLRRIPRGYRDKCWCGGMLLPLMWHKDYGVCSRCGCYVNKRPPSEFKDLYSLKFYWRYVQRYHGYPAIESRVKEYKRDGRLSFWLGLIAKYGPLQGTVVEVGCAPGVLLAELKARGYKCVGVEPDADTACWIKEVMNVEVKSGFFPDVDLPRCDLFLAFDVMEHVPDPLRFVEGISKLLNPGGVTIIQTPVERYGYEPPFGEKFNDAFNEFEHLFLFTNKAMEMLACHSGLEVVTLNERLWLHHEICVFKKPSHSENRPFHKGTNGLDG